MLRSMVWEAGLRHLLRLFVYIKPYKGTFTVAMATMILASLLVMASPLLVGWAIQFGLDPIRNDEGDVVGVDGDVALLWLGAAAIVVFALGRGATAFGQQYLSESIAQKIAYDIRNGIYDNVQRMSYAYHDKVQSGQIMSRATQDVEYIRMFITMGSLRLLYVLGMILVATIGMFIIYWPLAVITVLTLPFMAWRNYVIHKRLRPLWMEIQENQARLTEVSDEGLSGIRVVKAFSREAEEAAKFNRSAKEIADLQLKQSLIMARHNPLMQAVTSIQMALTVGAGAWFLAGNDILFLPGGGLEGREGFLFSFILWLNLLVLPVRMLGFIITSYARAISATERVFEVLDAQSAVQEKPDAIPLTNPAGHVRFENVSFGYDNVSPVLSNIDIDAEPGKVVALLGPTGSGKSTIVNLIPRFYDVTEGRITIDGIDIRDVTIDSLRQSIGIVQQDVFLFVGTIRDNIAYGRPEATQEQIEEAAKAARIHDFIMSLPYQYDEWVGERGVTLSGGQKQRVAIARTLLLDPPILIFDDSTASVDTQTEFLIQQALNELMKGRTTFVIAQRLRTVMRADEIVVLEKGRVVQRGRHDELLAQEGLYKRIYDLELKDQEDAYREDPKARAIGSAHGAVGGAN